MSKKPAGKYIQEKLKTPIKESHNGVCSDERMIALVQFLARCAAEDDFRISQELLASPDIIKGSN